LNQRYLLPTTISRSKFGRNFILIGSYILLSRKKN